MSSDLRLPPCTGNPAFTSAPDSSPLPPQSTSSIAGNIGTISIKDCKTDYLRIFRQSPTSYYVCLTTDHTPLYRIEFVENSSKVGDIQVFPGSNNAVPVAAVRLNTNTKPKAKDDPIAQICTSEPFLPESSWRPITRASTFSTSGDYRSIIPIVTVPGEAPFQQRFSWQTVQSEPFFELVWDGPLPFSPSSGSQKNKKAHEYTLATVSRGSAHPGQNLIEIRRGGGLEFELSVVLEAFVILMHQKKQWI